LVHNNYYLAEAVFIQFDIDLSRWIMNGMLLLELFIFDVIVMGEL